MMKTYFLVGALVLLISAETAGQSTFWQSLGRQFQKVGEEMLGDLVHVGVKAVNRTREIGCKSACPRLCDDKIGMYFCPFVCVPLCSRGKRSIRKGADYKGHLLPLPNKLAAYDLNDDGTVSLRELAFVTGHDVTQPDLLTVFQMADVNGDGMLTPKELYEGPFVFEKDIGDNDNAYCQYLERRRMRPESRLSNTLRKSTVL